MEKKNQQIEDEKDFYWRKSAGLTKELGPDLSEFICYHASKHNYFASKKKLQPNGSHWLNISTMSSELG